MPGLQKAFAAAAEKVKQFSYRNPECGLWKNMLMKKISPGLLFYYHQSHRVSVWVICIYL